MKLRTLLLFSLLAIAIPVFAADNQVPPSIPSAATTTAAPGSREYALAKAVEKQEKRHFDLHRFYIPLTQGNLQWLVATVGAKPEEAALVWKLMRDWDGARWTSVVSGSRNPS